MFEEFVAGAAAGDLLAALAPAGAQLDAPPHWGVFKFSRKVPKQGGHGAYEITCPFHILSREKKSLCKKLIAIQGSSDDDKREALRRARVWACQAQEHAYQYQHVHLASLEHNWSFTELEARRIDTMPSGVLDDQERFSRESPETKARLQAQRGRGRGGLAGRQPRANPRGKAKAGSRGPPQDVSVGSASASSAPVLASDAAPAPASSSSSSSSSSSDSNNSSCEG